MHLHILGICGTFMGGVALLARARGHRVTGSDANVYPPMSDQLAAAGIALTEGWDPAALTPAPDVVVVGNALSRGNPMVEHVLDQGLPYTSGPQWLAEQVLRERWVLAVAGTHGKTTTSSMLARILDEAGLDPGFLIGGVPVDFGVSARLGGGRCFVVEADEYDTAFFDKRSKFVHYHPRTAVLNNLEYDHADIFPDLAAIERQFHHLVRTVPGTGRIIRPAGDAALDRVLAMGCWTAVEETGTPQGWEAHLLDPDGSRFEVLWAGQPVGRVAWDLLGDHNVANALSAIAAARHAGVDPARACAALAGFRNVRRRLEARGRVNGVTVYDDFAHHPTAIRTTLEGLRRHVGGARVVAVLEPRSNTMRLGVHRDQLARALGVADLVVLYAPADLGWDAGAAIAPLGERGRVFGDLEAIVQHLVEIARPGDHLVVMSNGAFGGLHGKLLEALGKKGP
ncbi:MAG: UDP-N-acetylmuramate:L-alanyl-gamma-D-glutamyl-meso-diaminopimelate ligase [Gammaproteobacteria bacterium]|nr:UDP-N-acetylmuramate:L-alanyl-gamma-D-glutamyl-meso-diaminopimelate ligase [Gammaproteobacteria bacterium]